MINPIIKVIELFVDEEQDAILESISIVDKPAIEREFMYFSEGGRQMLFFQEEADQRIVVSPAMIPDKMIPRKDKDTDEMYYVYFSKESIAKAAEYLMKYNKQSHSNVNHQRIYSNDMYVMESWIKESQNDKSTDYGFGDLPEGTWFVKFRIMNDDVWKKIKSGELRGLSVEGDFLLGAEKYMSAKFKRHKVKYSVVRSKYKRVYKGLSEEEKDRMDQILFLVEMAAKDIYENAEEAVKRSKELGLKGEIHSFLDPETKTLMYMPGKDMAEYEEVQMEIVADLPNYVEQGEKKKKKMTGTPLSELEFADPEDLKVGDAVSWQTSGSNPRGRIREIVREGSKKVPGADFEIAGTSEDPGYIIELYEEDAEGNWKPTGTMVGRKADSILKNVDFTQNEAFRIFLSPLERRTVNRFINDVKTTYGL